jgi:hypothetical protein
MVVVEGSDGGMREHFNLDSRKNEALQRVRDNSVVEVFELGQQGIDRQLRDYIKFGARYHTGAGDQDRLLSGMVHQMASHHLRFALLRYTGGDVKIEGEEPFVLTSGSVVGVNASKQTLAYPGEWFERLLDARAGGRYSLDELTKAVTSADAANKFKSFSDILNLQEGPLKHAQGAGFLLLAFVDDRLRKAGLSQIMLNGVLDYYRRQAGVSFAFAYGRTPGLSAVKELAEPFSGEGKPVEAEALNSYLQEVLDGHRKDPGVGLHKNGALICGLPNSVEDGKSLNCGFLTIYDLRKR